MRSPGSLLHTEASTASLNEVNLSLAHVELFVASLLCNSSLARMESCNLGMMCSLIQIAQSLRALVGAP